MSDKQRTARETLIHRLQDRIDGLRDGGFSETFIEPIESALAALRAAPAPTVDVLHRQAPAPLAVAEPIDPHVTGRAKCRMCNHVCQSVAPVGTDLDNLECPNCHRMTLEVAP
jgi:hypothetical protein